MLLTEYDYDTDIAVQRNEAFNQGSYQKAVETAYKLLSMGLSLEQVAKGTGLPPDEVRQLSQSC